MAEGDIGTLIDTYELDTTGLIGPSVVRVSDNVFAITYNQTLTSGRVKTIGISDAGDITEPFIDEVSHATTDGNTFPPHIVRMYGDIYAVLYVGSDSKGWLKTIEITSAGQITHIAALKFEDAGGGNARGVKITDNMLAIAYIAAGNDGKIATVAIANDGTITSPRIDAWVFGTNTYYHLDIVKVTDNIIAILFTDSPRYAYIKTLEIANDGEITEAIIDTLSLPSPVAHSLSITHTTQNIYAFVFCDGDQDGYLRTVSINSAGDISSAYLDQYEFDPFVGLAPHIIHIGGNLVLVVYTAGNNNGQLITVEISGAGEITTPYVDVYEYDATEASGAFAFNVAVDMFAVVRQGVAGDGFTSTFPVQTQSGLLPRHELLFGIG